MSAFVWGRIIDRFEYDFDGKKVEVIKYLPNKYEGGCRLRGKFEDAPQFIIEELRESWGSLDAALIGWIARKRLGLNQYALVAGICKALDIN